MDPNTLNLKNQQTTSAQGGIPTVQAGGIAQLQQTQSNTGEYVPTPEDLAALDDTQKELRTRFALLPQEIQDTITSSGFQMKLFELAKKHQLTYDELGQLELDTTMVLLGMSHPDTFGRDLKESLRKDDVITNSLVKEIDEQVFAAIRTTLVSLYETKKRLEEGEDTDVAIENTPTVPLSQELVSKAPLTMTGGTPISIQFNQSPQPTPATSVVAQQPVVAPTLEKHENEALKSSGIEISATPFNTETHKDSFTSKLTGVFGVKSTTTDHTLPKMAGDATQTTKTPGVDPYREIV